MLVVNVKDVVKKYEEKTALNYFNLHYSLFERSRTDCI